MRCLQWLVAVPLCQPRSLCIHSPCCEPGLQAACCQHLQLALSKMPGCRAQLSDVVASVVGSALPPDQPLMEAGLDSLGAVELRNSLGTRFGIELGPTATFDYPTVAALAQHVAKLIGPAAGAVEQAFDAGVWDDGEGAPALQVVGMSCAYPGEAPALCWSETCISLPLTLSKSQSLLVLGQAEDASTMAIQKRHKRRHHG